MHLHGAHTGTAARFLLLPLTGLLAAGCAVGPNTGPAVVRDGGSPGVASSQVKKAPAFPALTGVKTDVDWRDCPPAMASRYGITPAPALTVQCATMMNRADPNVATGDSVTIPLIRIRLASTPAQAAPIVAVTGTDLPAGQLVLALANGPAGAALLAKHPVVAVEQRGVVDIDCMTRADRRILADNGSVGTGDDPQAQVRRVAAAARSAADSCTDALDDNAMAFTYAQSATDVEALRRKWGVDHIALLGIGTGTQVALSYAAQYAPRVGRLILDSPTPFTGSAKDRAAVRVRGVQQALDTFTRRCATNPDCRGQVADPGAVLRSVLDKARAGTLKDLDDATVSDAVMTTVGLATDQAGLRSLVAALQSADRGDLTDLTTMTRRTAALQTPDGMLVSRCNNVTGAAGLNEVDALTGDWGKQYPLVGQTMAISLARCTGWGTSSPASAPAGFAVPPLVFGAGADPVNGSDPTVLGQLFAAARSQPTSVSWDGVGYSVVAHSDCAARIVNDFLDATALGAARSRACPAG
ncbi:alpha/beta hydrolase [Gordonia defluvii]|uniref:Alpha/beta hydrolase n=1 Tax=Gordonia defluvii TaxID=283718 RepID=A0ABP6LPG0_9ACTN